VRCVAERFEHKFGGRLRETGEFVTRNCCVLNLEGWNNVVITVTVTHHRPSHVLGKSMVLTYIVPNMSSKAEIVIKLLNENQSDDIFHEFSKINSIIYIKKYI
jgi:c-di-AMP phosphodiesterase-like protein